MSPIVQLLIELLPVILKLFDCPDTSVQGLLARAKDNPEARRLVENARARQLARQDRKPFRWRQYREQARAEVHAEMVGPRAEANMELACVMCGCHEGDDA